MIEFSIPIKVVPKNSARTGKGRWFTPKRVKANAKELAAAIIPYAPDKPFEGPVHLRMMFYYPFRKAENKAWRKWGWRGKFTTPDADNLGKQLADVLEFVGFFTNDAQIVWYESIKVWWPEWQTRVMMEPLEEDLDGPSYVLQMGYLGDIIRTE